MQLYYNLLYDLATLWFSFVLEENIEMEFAFLLKKFISFFIEPLGLVFLFGIIGLYFLYKEKKKNATLFFSSSFFLLFFFSYQPISTMLVAFLENEYKGVSQTQNIRYIHVLGTGHKKDSQQPITSQISDSGVKRVTEGVRLHFLHPDSILIFTGYEGDTDRSNAQVNATLARSLGVKSKNIIIDSEAKDTQEEAVFCLQHVKKEPFILVTSATHMPRAISLFRSLGLQPIAAPTDFKTDTRDFFSLPSIKSLQNSHYAVHEYLGLLWAKI